MVSRSQNEIHIHKIEILLRCFEENASKTQKSGCCYAVARASWVVSRWLLTKSKLIFALEVMHPKSKNFFFNIQ